jgi:hypothetical protein
MYLKRIPRNALVLIFAGIFAGAAQGQSNDALLNKLVSKGILTAAEAEDLKKESESQGNKASRSLTGLPEWVTQLKFYGDLRGRWDLTSTENAAPGADQPNNDRSRFRYRLRFGAMVQMKESLEVGFRLTSGEPGGFGGDPISGNASFEDNGSKKFVYIDQAYGKWTPINQGPWLLSGTIGKMENPFIVSDMVFDADYTPEGIGIDGVYKINPEHHLKFRAGFFMLDEISQGSEAGNDPFLSGAQVRHDAKWSSAISSSVGFAWMGLSGEENLVNEAVPNINVGNSRYAAAAGGHRAGELIENFAPIIVDASITYTLDSFPLYRGSFPLRLGGEYIVNPAADRMNEGYWAGLFLGKSGKKGTWELSYRYKHLESDAWYEEFVDSDTGAYHQTVPAGFGRGPGYLPGTGLQGHVIKAAYSPANAFTISLTYYRFELIDAPPLAGRAESAAHRVQLDAIWQF